MSEPEKIWGFPVFRVELGGKPQPLPGALPLTVNMPNPNERAVRHALDAAGATADDLRAGGGSAVWGGVRGVGRGDAGQGEHAASDVGASVILPVRSRLIRSKTSAVLMTAGTVLSFVALVAFLVWLGMAVRDCRASGGTPVRGVWTPVECVHR